VESSTEPTPKNEEPIIVWRLVRLCEQSKFPGLLTSDSTRFAAYVPWLLTENCLNGPRMVFVVLLQACPRSDWRARTSPRFAPGLHVWWPSQPVIATHASSQRTKQELVRVLDNLKPWRNRPAVKELHEALRP
jgi:hypothetical protein